MLEGLSWQYGELSEPTAKLRLEAGAEAKRQAEAICNEIDWDSWVSPSSLAR